MERFYFDLYNTVHTQMDSEGQLFSSAENARKEALRILQDVARDEMPNSDNLKITIKMRTDKRGQIFEASLTVKSAWS
ncbi:MULTISPECIES: hypothetical protein [unclassified Mesorhizobium]|uniref:DUF6894 family protein n=1 Tax=unclassified Mesorhizobium TaxID=325217 RepID=UPI000FE670F5|nr:MULTISPECIES: hypothetical protein [unclassified Mesorhizobium]MDG4855244.1 hypothetical protein [Mesorhizobium sp. WSM4982]MDG4901244.1 hypothetical protein [Mesorhizobium sp. WSM4962]MDG4913814.1 hypothetical protein [Mesorhizobium sp. WSM4983]MDG4916517.1 hypothetical protein [Mesorhizobium sp. WSM4989]RWI92353.1 MAG: hypothetical protein EOR22_19915 [Mesorhizobium sp.]